MNTELGEKKSGEPSRIFAENKVFIDLTSLRHTVVSVCQSAILEKSHSILLTVTEYLI